MTRKVQVARVIDGDTFETAAGERIRLANVYAPEKGTTGAAAATNRLRNLIDGKQVEIDVQAYGKYGRIIAKVKAGGSNVNKAMRDHLERGADGKGKTSTKKKTPAKRKKASAKRRKAPAKKKSPAKRKKAPAKRRKAPAKPNKRSVVRRRPKAARPRRKPVRRRKGR